MDAVMHGEVDGQHSVDEVALIVDGEVRQSSHYNSGSYVSVERNQALATFEIAESTTLVEGDAESLQPLVELSAFISARLTSKNLRHRLELYVGDSLVSYCHHAWPSASPQGA